MDHVTEQFCNRTAAEFLVPERELQAFWPTARGRIDPYEAIARQFKVSSLVAARRTLDLKLIGEDDFSDFYRELQDQERHRQQTSKQSGGEFWGTQKWRLGPRFGGAIVRAVKEDRLLYREAYNLTGLRGDTFEKISEKMEVLL